MAKIYKKYVAIRALIGTDGELRPTAIIWEDGREYPVAKILEHKFAESSAGSGGYRYKLLVVNPDTGRQSTRYLFKEKNRFFIETTKKPESVRKAEEEHEALFAGLDPYELATWGK